jgi:S-adenosylmethionine decarboxylase
MPRKVDILLERDKLLERYVCEEDVHGARAEISIAERGLLKRMWPLTVGQSPSILPSTTTKQNVSGWQAYLNTCPAWPADLAGNVGDNQGLDGFVPLIDSGISVYVWTTKKFMSTVLFTCKEFEVQRAVEFVKNYFVATNDIVWKEF